MSSPAYATPLRLNWRPCRRVAALLCVLYAGGLVALWLAPMHWGAQVPATLVVLWRAALDLRRHAWLSAPDALVALEWDGEDRWWLHTCDGRCDEGALYADAYVSAWLVVLAFKTPGGRCAVLLHGARTMPEGLRRLRVRLRISVPAAAGSPVA